MSGRKPLEGGLGETSRDALDDGKRASAAIEVLRAQAPLERGLGKTIGAEITGFRGIWVFSFDLCSVPLGYA